MNTYFDEMKRYTALNELASAGGVVVLGGTEDQKIPVGELAQAFNLNVSLYNRSFQNLTVSMAQDVYDHCVAPLRPESILLHIGEADVKRFEADSSAFDRDYRNLIAHIRKDNRKCKISVISLKNPESSVLIDNLNKHLKYIAESEQCQFGDIAAKRVWNPIETKEVISFVYSMGFTRALKNKMSDFNIIKILFCYDAAQPADDSVHAVKKTGRFNRSFAMPEAATV